MIDQTAHGVWNPLKPQPENIPDTLKSLPWAVFKGESRPNGGISKAPRHPHTGGKIAANKPEQWSNFDACIAAVQAGRFEGIGVLLGGAGPQPAGAGLVGIDIDHATELFKRRPEVKALVRKAVTKGVYCERSPSGTGLRMFALGTTPKAGQRGDGIEVYTSGRFLSLTGHTLKGVAPQIGEDQELINETLALLDKGTETPAREVTRRDLTGGEVRQMDPDTLQGIAAKVATKVGRVWSGDWERRSSQYGTTGFESQSDADFHVLCEIARGLAAEGIAPDTWPEHMGAIFGQSALAAREKWDRSDYREHSIAKAIADVRKKGTQGGGQAGPVTREGGAKGDILNAQVFALLYRGSLLWVHELNVWLAFDPASGWTQARPEATTTAYKAVLAELQARLAAKLAALNGEEAPTQLKRLMLHIERSQTLPKVQGCVELAKSEADMSVLASELNANRDHIGLGNGILDLRTFELRPYTPDVLVTKRMRASFDPEAQCPQWNAFLKEVLPDQEVRKFLRVFFGYLLTGSVEQQKFLFLYGTGANGKSVFIATLQRVLGEYARRIPTEMLMAQPRSSQGASPDLLLLKDIRLAFANETEEGDRLADSRVKDLTSQEPITARPLYGQHITFTPTHSLVLVGNHEPIVHDDTLGMWRRLCLIPFEVTIPHERQDPNLYDKLIAESDGILLWMLRGLRDYRREGLRVPASVQAATRIYRAEMDVLGDWIGERCQTGPGESVPKRDLFENYRSWATVNNFRPMTANSLTRRLKSRGIPLDSGRRTYLGIGLKDRAAP